MFRTFEDDEPPSGRKVYIGGFGGSRRTARYTADGIAEYYDWSRADVEHFTFAEVMEPDFPVLDMLRRAFAVTHSAGTLALEGGHPYQVIAVAPPFPSSKLKLVVRSGLKTAQLIRSAYSSDERFSAVRRLNARNATELLRHPYGNLRHIGAIARFNASLAAKRLSYTERVRIICMRSDAFGFYPPPALEKGGELYWVDGEHDEFLLNPGGVLEEMDRQAC